jgi:hypothetical protein
MDGRLTTYDAAQQHYGTWLLGYDWNIYGCGTYRDPLSTTRAQMLMTRYMEKLSRKVRSDVAYVACLENRPGNYSGLGMSEIPRHWHFLAASPRGVSLKNEASALWWKHFGDVKVDDYDATQNGAFYTLKLIDHDNGTTLIENLGRLEYKGPSDLILAAQCNQYVPDDLKYKTHGKFLTVR